VTTSVRLPQRVESGEISMAKYLEQWERAMVNEAMRLAKGNTAKAAKILGMQGDRPLHYMLERWGIKTPQ
jgi:transcriptional regulator with GAF, ATPase, and Fis domain